VTGEFVERGDVQYAWNDGVAIAYQVVGDSGPDLLYLPPYPSNLDWHWEFGPYARYLERIASFCRLIIVDRRGWGLSDRVGPGSFPPLEVAADDLLTVLDAVGSSQAALFAGAEAGWIAAIAAATHPTRFTSLVLYQAAACWVQTKETPWNMAPQEYLDQVDYWKAAGSRSFNEQWIAQNEPSLVGDVTALDWLTKLDRATMGMGCVAAEYLTYAGTDVRSILPAIRTPTLVLYRPANQTEAPESGPFLASKIPNSRLVALPGADYSPWVGEPEPLLAELSEFLTGVRQEPDADRVLATVLFTDIVGSTDLAARLGDHAWKAQLASHDERVRTEIERFRGKYVNTTGDGVLATFDGPARAVRCAQAISQAVAGLGFEIRAGCHTGEIEVAGDDIQGIAVHIGARVAALAGPSQIYVSATVKDLVAGSGLDFEDVGEQELKGVPDRWHLYRAVA
jgi:class 3 adenylate cyclase